MAGNALGKAIKKTIGRAPATMKRRGVKGLVHLYRQQRGLEARAEVVDSAISSIQIEPTKMCNQRCPMCSHPELDKSEMGHMSFESFVKVFDQFPQVTTVKLQGLGEILTNPEIWKMLEHVNQRGVRVLFATNGALLDETAARNIIALGNVDVRFSLDTLDSEKYRKIRGSRAYERVIHNLKQFCELRSAHGRKSLFGQWFPSAEIRMVYMADTADELADMVRFAADVGLERVTATYLLSKEHTQAQKAHAKSKIEQAQEMGLDGMMAEAKEVAADVGVTLKTISYSENHLARCDWPWRMPYITYDGYVTSCCHIENPKASNFGNVLETPFEEIWNGERYRQMRAHFTDLDINTNCRLCPYLCQES